MWEEKIFRSARIKDGYLNYYRWSVASGEAQPLLIYLHGAGSRGTKLSSMSRVGPLGELDRGRDIPAVVVAPQCHENTWFDLYGVLVEFIERCMADPAVDPNRVYLCGISMGAYAAWQVAMSHPNWFAALVPVCGGGMYWNAARLKHLPVWAFHGEEDDVVSCEESIRMVDAVNKHGGNAKLTLYPNTKHNAWEQAYSEDAMWSWMFAQRKRQDADPVQDKLKTDD